MGTDTERFENVPDTALLESWENWYHVPLLVVAVLFMVWTRVRNYEQFITDNGSPALAGVDSWYHWRSFQWTAENYPHTMPFEIWTSFPTGQYVGQFGTFFDQIVVTVAMIVGLGDPSAETLYITALFVVPIIAALVAVPVFFIGRRIGGTIGGLFSVFLLALLPDRFSAEPQSGSSTTTLQRCSSWLLQFWR
ncbi:MAG: STT3 domain-containing protein [Natrialbaceae archaeon]|nr:STT3 domain-containing protein [Natrialbaceae archaeon]